MERVKPIDNIATQNHNFLPTRKIINEYRQIDSRSDIEEMISWYSWIGQNSIGLNDIGNLVGYHDYVKSSPFSILTNNGRDRTLRSMSEKFKEKREELPVEFVEQVDSITLLIKAKRQLPPILVLSEPYEFYNGQVVDGMHRLIAIGVYAMENNLKDYKTPAFIGFDRSPVLTRTRWAKNAIKLLTRIKNK